MSAPKFKGIHLVLVGVVAGGVVAAASSFSKSSPDNTATQVPAPIAPVAKGPAQSGTVHATPGLPPQAGAQVIEGEVLEALDVPGYTYARIGAKGSEGTWAAFPTAKLAVGDRVKVNAQMEMNEFASTTLKRTFKSIWFGMLDDGGKGAAVAPAAPGDPAGSAHPAMSAAAAAAPVEIKNVEKAAGPDGKTVAEILGQRTALNGKTVRVRAIVVKSNPGILGKTYLHVRDGSGDEKAGTHDLSVTMDAVPKVGDTVLLEGVIGLDRDIGSGYKFPTILENAKIVSP
ncbi:MAG: hypothetical protein HYV09_28730 [Deltaproteobacteria bacterium]|nr:hypothetical protein [Deltaproteobacteria bacterium]